MRQAIVLAISLWAGACSPPAPPTGRAGSSHAPSLLSPEQRQTGTLSSRWLVGYWDHRPACFPGGGGTSLWEDGTYTMDGGYGRWSLSGSTLNVIEVRPPDVQLFQARIGDGGRKKVKIVGPDTISIQWPDGPIGLFYRCGAR